MALTDLQRRICRRLAESRIEAGESYVAGGAALHEVLGTRRISRDIDLFHDTDAALERTWAQDRRILLAAGMEVRVVRERPSYVEAEVALGGESVILEWTRDSAYRFFPLVEHVELGLTLHPLDLATNKVLALIGRVEARDWIDVLACVEHVQPLGYLAWAACGKDPGFGPAAVLEHAARTTRYSAAEVAALHFDGGAPDAAELSRRWKAELGRARAIVAELPAEEAGKCVLSAAGEAYRGDLDELRRALPGGELRFHAGSIRGAWPELRRGGSGGGRAPLC